MSSHSDKQTFLRSTHVQALLRTHPNSFDHNQLPDLPDEQWTQLLRPDFDNHLLHDIRRLQLDRRPIPIDHLLPLPSEQGMSPKKAHEVARMATYIVNLVRRLDPLPIRIVDVGAGQGYLTRTLKFHLPQSHILALDADENQTRGAQRWEQRLLPSTSPPIAHKTILISPETLQNTITSWVREVGDHEQPVPVLFVALHACGSLTPDLLRTFIASIKNQSIWNPAGVVAVGCCYNLMNPSDFPLTKPQSFDLPTSAFHLAAQIPSHWLQSVDPPLPFPSVSLAVRKVTWRALLGKALENATPTPEPIPPLESTTNKSATVPARWSRRPDTWNPTCDNPPTLNIDPEDLTTGVGETPAMRRLGKLPNSAYADWNTFLKATEHRMRVKFPLGEFENLQGEGGRDRALERKLESLHTWRCLLGPVVESAILEDRLEWICDELLNLQVDGAIPIPLSFQAELVNLFDQATGSGRNVAIVVSPRLQQDEKLQTPIPFQTLTIPKSIS